MGSTRSPSRRPAPRPKEFAKFKLTVGEVVAAKEQACTTESAKKYPITAKLKKGKQPLVIEFLNDAYKEDEYDRNLFVHGEDREDRPRRSEVNCGRNSPGSHPH